MGGIVAAVVVLLIVAADFGGTYWISKRTGLYGWALEQLGPPRRQTGFFLGLHRLGAVGFCIVLIGVPIQGAVAILAGVAAAIGVL